MEEISTETIYQGSVACPGCGTHMTPLEHMWAGNTSECGDCRNTRYSKAAKSMMSGKRR